MRESGRRRTRLVVGIGGLVAVAALTIMVLPAIGVIGGFVDPPSAAGVLPTEADTGGQSNDCALFGFPSPPYSSYRIDSPKSQRYDVTADGSIAFTLSVASSGANKDKIFDYVAKGAAVYAIGVKGGANTTKYLYRAASPASAAIYAALAKPGETTKYSDSGLHAPRDNQGKLYSVSNVTFCFKTAETIDGTVYNDLDGDGTKDGASEPGIPNATVTLYGGAAPITALSNSSGGYTFSNVAVDKTYTVCQTSLGASFTQTEPDGGSSVACTTEQNQGYSVALTTANSGLNFGNMEATVVTCGETFGNLPDYRIRLNSPPSCTKSFIIDYSDPSRTASLQPVGGGGLVPMVEYIRWSLPADGTQVELLKYDDTLPYTDPKEMLHCKIDPRAFPALEGPAADDDDLKLASLLPADSAVFPTAPAGYDARAGLVTSCIILDKEKAGYYVTYVYSAIDGLRVGG